MTDDIASNRSHRAVPVLLGLMVFAQLAIANEIRYQGCVARFYDAAAASGGPVESTPEQVFDCSRVPLL